MADIPEKGIEKKCKLMVNGINQELEKYEKGIFSGGGDRFASFTNGWVMLRKGRVCDEPICTENMGNLPKEEIDRYVSSLFENGQIRGFCDD